MPQESKKNKQLRATRILNTLMQHHPPLSTFLTHNNTFELLIAVILSAQCTDERVNRVTKKLFKKYQTPKDFDILSLNSLKQEIYSTGFYNNKAKILKRWFLF